MSWYLLYPFEEPAGTKTCHIMFFYVPSAPLIIWCSIFFVRNSFEPKQYFFGWLRAESQVPVRVSDIRRFCCTLLHKFAQQWWKRRHIRTKCLLFSTSRRSCNNYRCPWWEASPALQYHRPLAAVLTVIIRGAIMWKHCRLLPNAQWSWNCNGKWWWKLDAQCLVYTLVRAHTHKSHISSTHKAKQAQSWTQTMHQYPSVTVYSSFQTLPLCTLDITQRKPISCDLKCNYTDLAICCFGTYPLKRRTTNAQITVLLQY